MPANKLSPEERAQVLVYSRMAGAAPIRIGFRKKTYVLNGGENLEFELYSS